MSSSDEYEDSQHSDDDESLSSASSVVDERDAAPMIKSADAWGKKKTHFYNSHADQDWGGWDEDEAEALELEEEDAVARQKKLDAGIEAVDFAALLASDDEEETPKVSKSKKTTAIEKIPTKLEDLNKAQQLDYVMKHSPNFDGFVTEYNERKAQFEELSPLLTGILSSMNDHECAFTRQIKAIIAAYTQYLQSYSMFFYLKDSTPIEKFKTVENHPVLDDIMKQFPIMKEVDEFVETNLRRLTKVADRLKVDPEYAEIIARPEPPKKKARVEVVDEQPVEPEPIGEIFARMARGEGKGKSKPIAPHGPALDDDEEADGDEKRKITYEMQKNKGLTVKRKIAHSRVKKRHQYKKAIHVRRSQVPDVQREISKYDGERRGIRASNVRSIKLKA